MNIDPKEYEKRIADFRQVVDDETGKCWWEILCRWCGGTLERYEKKDFPKSAPLSVLSKLVLHVVSCPELAKKRIR